MDSHVIVHGATDAHGAFTVNGLLPGTLYLGTARYDDRTQDTRATGAWVLSVPESGVRDLKLRISSEPAAIESSRYLDG